MPASPKPIQASTGEIQMKTGKTLTQLAQQLEDIKANARDFLVPTAKLKAVVVPPDIDDGDIENGPGKCTPGFVGLEFKNGGKEPHLLRPSAYAHGQIASYANVPKQYYDRLAGENPELLTKNVNHGFAKQSQSDGRGKVAETRMVRAYKGDVRAVLSSKYRRLDSYDMCQAVLPVLIDGRFEVVSSEITDTRFYIKALTKRVQTDIKPGDTVQYGLVISNSEVGAGSVRVEPLIYRLVCSNGLIMDTAPRKFHVGKNLAGDDVQDLLSAETISLTDKAFWAQVTDLVKVSMQPETFEAKVNLLREAANEKIKNFDIPEVIEMAMKATGTSGEGVKQDIIAYLANGADGAGLTKWGLINGYTYAAQAEKIGYDQSIELERAGSRILDLPKHQWERISA